MTIFAFDPGSVASGVAWLDTVTDQFYAGQFADPVEAWQVLEEEGDKDDPVLVEIYRSGGHLTKHAAATIEVVGYFKYAARYGWGWGPSQAIERVEQHRLSGRREAAELMEGTIEALEKDPERKDAFSALAHCCAYRRSLNV